MSDSARPAPDSEASADARAQMRAELSARVREALELRDWRQLERWAKHWIQIDPRYPSGFKWLARASLALGKVVRAAYGYGRLLDFEPVNAEALQFFAQNPSAKKHAGGAVAQSASGGRPNGGIATVTGGKDRTRLDPGPEHALSPEVREQLAELELASAKVYFLHRLFARAAQRFRASFEWRATQAAALGLARSLHSSEQGFEATRFLRDRLYDFPDWIEGRLLLGRILFEIGSQPEAQREWQMVLGQDPRNEQALSFLRLLMTTTV